MKKFCVRWEEIREIEIEANNEEEAIEQVMAGDFPKGADNGIEITRPPYVVE